MFRDLVYLYFLGHLAWRTDSHCWEITILERRGREPDDEAKDGPIHIFHARVFFTYLFSTTTVGK